MEVRVELRGAARKFLTDKSPEIGMVGSAGTGKTVGGLWKAHLASLKYPNCRTLLARKEATSLTATTIQGFERTVLPDALRLGLVRFYGGSSRQPPAYLYQNGSTITLAGLDKPERIMSAEFDRILVDEATDITYDSYQLLLSRLRGKAAPYRQIGLLCNPQHPTHWIKERADAGKLNLLTSRHVDNPRFFHRNGNPTPAGAEYMSRLGTLTGVRRLRLLEGIWAAAEGVIYENFDAGLHVVDPFPVPWTWRRIWSVDFGYTHPFVWQDWALDGDGRAYLVRQIHMTGRLVEDHCQEIKRLALSSPDPSAIVCDHDAEDRATFERHMGLGTVPAEKAVSAGIEAVKSRLKIAGDGRPRLMIFRDALVEKDQTLVDRKLPFDLVTEMPGYIWAPEPAAADRKREIPVKKNDDSCDAARYAVAEMDLHGSTNVRWG